MSRGQTLILTGLSSRQKAESLVNAAPSGSVLNIKPPRRTIPQNDRFWAMVSDISRAKPEGRVYPPEVWKALLMAEAGFKPLFEPSLDGMGVIPVGYKSSRLTKAEFSDLIEAAFAYGARHGVQWSNEP
jgi:hypothetical protein